MAQNKQQKHETSTARLVARWLFIPAVIAMVSPSAVSMKLIVNEPGPPPDADVPAYVPVPDLAAVPDPSDLCFASAGAAAELCATAGRSTDYFIIAQVCDGVQLSPDCWKFWGKSKCKNNWAADYQMPSLAAYNFDNKISSAAGYNNCWVKLYDQELYKDRIATCKSQCLDLDEDGAGDRASSMQLW